MQNSFMKTVNIDSHKVEANDSQIIGSNNIIFGNNNRITGDNNKIYGNNNAVIGHNNIAKGEYNNAHGNNNEVRDPFGNAYSISNTSSNPLSPTTTTAAPTPSSSHQFFAPIDIPRTAASSVGTPPSTNTNVFQPIANNHQYPPASPRNTTYEYPPASPRNTAYDYTPHATYDLGGGFSAPFSPPVSAPAYLQPQPVIPRSLSPAPSAYLVVGPSPVPFNTNPFSPPASPTPFASPFDAPQPTPQHKEAKKEDKDKDLIQDGTLLFIINESESEYVREFCQILSANSGQRVGCHLSCGRMCVVGLGDLDKIRDNLINLLPMLNLKLKEWSWNTFGKNVCNDKEVYFKRLFKEYTKEDVDCWRNKPTKITV